MMIAIVTLVSLCMIAIGFFGLVSPPGLADFVARWESPEGLWLAVALRLTFGLALWLAAPATQTPVIFQVLALLVVGAGLALPLLGLDRFKSILSWWRRLPPNSVRLWTSFPLLLGFFILWSTLA